jgi:hypothetical protein
VILEICWIFPHKNSRIIQIYNRKKIPFFCYQKKRKLSEKSTGHDEPSLFPNPLQNLDSKFGLLFWVHGFWGIWACNCHFAFPLPIIFQT